VLSSREKDKFDGKKENPFILSSGKKPEKKISRILPQSEGEDQKVDNQISDEKADFSDDSPPIRKEKVKEAKRKKQKGDYDNQEIYKKIADRLIDLFGV